MFSYTIWVETTTYVVVFKIYLCCGLFPHGRQKYNSTPELNLFTILSYLRNPKPTRFTQGVRYKHRRSVATNFRSNKAALMAEYLF